MKRKSIFAVFFFALLSILSGSFAAASQAPITDVTVFPDRAQITRRMKITLPAGNHIVLFENLPYRAYDNSFRASISGGDKILISGLEYETIQHEQAPREEIASLEEKIYQLERFDRQAVVDRIDVIEKQKDLLLQIKVKSSEDMSQQFDRGNLDISQWIAAYQFVGQTFSGLADSLSAAKRELDKLDKKLAMLKNQLQKHRAAGIYYTKTVSVEVLLDRPDTINLTLNYMVPDASWMPQYDARLNDMKGLVDVTYFAEIRQNTGEDWDNVSLTLSTATPSAGAGPGELGKWFLNIFEQYRASKMAQPSAFGDLEEKDEIASPEEARELAVQAANQIVNNGFNTTFKSMRKETVATGGDARRTPLMQFALESDVDLISRPRNREGAFRLAHIANNTAAPFLPGRVAIFAGADFLGHSALARFIAPGQEFDLPFGIDNNVTVKREIVDYKRDFKNSIFSNNEKIKVKQTVKITLTNNHREARDVRIEELLPVAQDGRIKVDIGDVNPKGVKSDDESEISWDMTLAAGQELIITLPIEIEYPQGLQISGI